MKLMRHRFRVLFLLLLLLLAASAALLFLRGLRSPASSGAVPGRVLTGDLSEDIIPGRIWDRAGALLAETRDGVRTYAEPAERRASLVHLLGLPSDLIPGGVETLRAADLYGLRPNLSEAVSRLIKKQPRSGFDLTLTVSAGLCEEILRAAASHPETAGKACCAVVIHPVTGEIAAMASLPTFDPQNLTQEEGEALKTAAGEPLLNRVTEGVYPLGTLESAFSPIPFPLSGALLFRDLVTVEANPPMVTPLRLCLMACAVAADGIMPEPRLISTVKTSAGGVVVPWSTASLGRYCSAEEAARRRDAMKAAVSSGAAPLYDPTLNLHAMTGTAPFPENAEAGPGRFDWCVAFNSQPDLPWALCVLVEDPSPAEGDSHPAALIAGDLFAWIKAHPQLVDRKE